MQESAQVGHLVQPRLLQLDLCCSCFNALHWHETAADVELYILKCTALQCCNTAVSLQLSYSTVQCSAAQLQLHSRETGVHVQCE